MVRKAIEALNKQNIALLIKFIVPDYVDHPNRLQGREDFKQLYIGAFRSFLDLRVTLEDIIAEGDKVWVRATIAGTHTGEYRGIAPTGKKIIFTAVFVWRMIKGRIVGKESEVGDMLNFYKQLGVIEYTEKAKKLFLEDVS